MSAYEHLQKMFTHQVVAETSRIRFYAGFLLKNSGNAFAVTPHIHGETKLWLTDYGFNSIKHLFDASVKTTTDIRLAPVPWQGVMIGNNNVQHNQF